MNDYQDQTWRTEVVIAYVHDQEKNNNNKKQTEKKNKNKETKTVRGELLLLETAGHKALKKTEK